jgi:hypothetical protein
MREFIGTDELKGARIRDSDLSGAQLRSVNFSNVSITDAWLFDTSISGAIRGLRVNGVEVAPLIEAELDRRHPERTRLRPTDVAGLRTALDAVDEMWAPTLERARALPREALHERVQGEYSFVETLRHLLFATDAWLTRMVLRVPHGYHEWAVPPDLPVDAPPDDGPELDEVLEVRSERAARLRAYLDGAEDAALAQVVTPPDSTGHPQGAHQVRACFQVVMDEEWWHHQYATRDLTILEGRARR